MRRMRLFLTLTCITLLLLPAKAERVDIEKAEKIARSYTHTTPRLAARKALRHSRTVTEPLQRNRSALRSAGQGVVQQEEPLYHVFTMNGDGGFIIISGDDVAKPVLGYADEGMFDESNPNLAYWMGALAQEIAGAIESGVLQDVQTKAAWDALYSSSIPLTASGDYMDPLVKTKWDQGAPYNNLCPMSSGERTVTGCVATAVAQIMKYHEHPTTRTVTIPGYTTGTRKITIPAITGTTAYDWDNMTNTYTSSSTGAPASAVATLMYHCGAGVKMDYNTSANGGSGAYSQDVVQALKTYFNYDAGIAYHQRNYYTYAVWIALLKAEIRANRPVYYAGYGGGGHAFVCDGYDTGNLFHFNWGWGGISNGYFEVSALNPGSLGIGGGAGGFNENQELITGIRPNQGGSGEQPAIRLGLSTFSAGKTSLYNVTESFSVSAGNLTNTGITTIASAYLGVLLYNQDGSYRDHKT
ncbi:MAG: C10 family peptidase, partial [Prevotellaceae bacterium]|nr:C10 family peptidase [Prevotellaceae bacterium]